MSKTRPQNRTPGAPDMSSQGIHDQVSGSIAAKAWLRLHYALQVAAQRWRDSALLQFHEAGQTACLGHLAKDIGFCKSVLDFDRKCLVRCRNELDLGRPDVLLNFLTLLCSARAKYLDVFEGDDRALVERGAGILFEHAATEWLAAIHPQVKGVVALVELVLEVASSFDGKRLVLPDLPVGNSLLVAVLATALRAKGHTVATPMVALTRNSTARKGVTRKELLREMVAREIQTDDVVIYVDEWNTGSNFKALSGALDSALRPLKATLVPIAVLSPSAKEQSTWDSCVRHHDKLAEAGSYEGNLLRIGFEPLPHWPHEVRPFFWSENDRVAGYRKLQLLGSILSTLHATIESLETQRERLRTFNVLLTFGLHLEAPTGWRRKVSTVWMGILRKAIRHSKKLPGAAYPRVRRTLQRLMPLRAQFAYELERMFQDGLHQYRTLKVRLDALYHPSNDSPVNDLEEALGTIQSAIMGIVGARSPAHSLLILANFHWTLWGSPDPADRYPFQAHVPVAMTLEGNDRLLHARCVDLLLDALVATGP